MSSATRDSRASAIVVVLFAIGVLRIVTLLAHEPLVALANSFDQARYTGCFDLFPDRPAAVRPDENSPAAPYEAFRFQRNPTPLCYGSSELIVQAVAVALYRIDAMLGGGDVHSVRVVAALRFALLLAIALALTRAWLRRGDRTAALANAAVFALLLADPSNTVYFATLYAEATALLSLYLLIGLLVLWWGETMTRTRAVSLAFAALLLATSKIQHLALPLAIAIATLAFGRLHARRWPWQGAALLAGALVGATMQFAQLARDDSMMRSIRSYNRADVVFTGVLPAVGDPEAVIGRLGMPAHCIEHVGKRAWQLPDLAELVCPGIERVGRADLVGVFAREPLALMRFVGGGIAALDAWLPRGLGFVADRSFARLPAAFATSSTPLERSPALRYGLFVLALIAGALAWYRDDPFALVARAGATTMLATLAVTLVGDGLADVAKQGHLVFNAALAVVVVGVVGGLARRSGGRATSGGAVDAVDFDEELRAADVA
jgi:hypothetical protein